MSKFEKIYLTSPDWLQSVAVYIYGKRQFTKRYSGIYREILNQVRESELWTDKEKYDYQCEKMNVMLRYCSKNIPYYQRLFIDYGIIANNITTIEELKQIPILKKETLRENPDSFRSSDKKLIHATQKTSGSTGTPISLNVDEETYKLAMALLVNFEENNRVPFRTRRATFAGRLLKSTNTMSPPFWKYNQAENQLLFSSYHLNKNTFSHYEEKLNEFRPIELIGYPSSIYELANHYFDKGIRPKYRPELIVTNSENLMTWQRDKIQEVFDCKVKDYYSTAEYLNFASENNEGIYKSNPLPGVTELAPLESGDIQSRLIMTTLTNKAMPLIRYDVGDLAVADNDSSMYLGNPTLLEIEGRIDEYLETTDGRKIGRVSQIFKGIPGVREAQIIQHNPGEATFNIVSETPANKLSESIIMENTKLRLGDNFKINIKYTNHIPKQKNGKFRFVIKD